MQVKYYAAARAAAGCAAEEVATESLGDAATVQQLVTYLSAHHTGRTASGMSFAQVLSQCSFLVDGSSAPLETVLSDSSRVDVLPPFAGG